MRLFTNDSTKAMVNSVVARSQSVNGPQDWCEYCNRRKPNHRTDCPLHPLADMRDR
jgi:hypothetical protein